MDAYRHGRNGGSASTQQALQCGPMSEATLLLPFALPPAEHAKDLLAALDAPALAMALARAAPGRRQDGDAFAAMLPHEALLSGTAADTSPAIAAALMHRLAVPSTAGYWFVLQPVHFHVARDHLVLTDPSQLVLDDLEARTLFDAVQPLFAELGHELRYGSPRYWFLRADAWHTLRTCTPAAATGHNVDVWLPRGAGERDWRRLHNEVQMQWHIHPLNEQRELRGQNRVNALWLWGGAVAGATTPNAFANQLIEPSVEQPGDPAAGSLLQVDSTLIASALAGDWGSWLAALQAIDRQHIAPRLAAMRSGELTRLTLQLTDAQRLREWHLSRGGMRKFWRSPSLARLID